MGAKNDKGFNQEAIDMFKNGTLNQYDLNRLLANSNMSPHNMGGYGPNMGAGGGGNRYHMGPHQHSPHIGGNHVNSPRPPPPPTMGYPPKPPRQPGEPNIIMTGSLASSRMSHMNPNEMTSKGYNI